MSSLPKTALASVVSASVAALFTAPLWAQTGGYLPEPIQRAMPGSGSSGYGQQSTGRSQYPAVPGPYTSPNNSYNAPAAPQSAQPWGNPPEQAQAPLQPPQGWDRGPQGPNQTPPGRPGADQGYGGPQGQGYNSPQGYPPYDQNYGAPQGQGFGSPQEPGAQPSQAGMGRGYNAPQSQNFGAPPPAQGYNGPQGQGYGGPQGQGYDAPQGQGYGAPQGQGYGPGYVPAPQGHAPVFRPDDTLPPPRSRSPYFQPESPEPSQQQGGNRYGAGPAPGGYGSEASRWPPPQEAPAPRDYQAQPSEPRTEPPARSEPPPLPTETYLSPADNSTESAGAGSNPYNPGYPAPNGPGYGVPGYGTPGYGYGAPAYGAPGYGPGYGYGNYGPGNGGFPGFNMPFWPGSRY